MMNRLTLDAFSSSSNIPAISLPYFAFANLRSESNDCSRLDVECRVDAFANFHEPLSDGDGDLFAPTGSDALRGNHWRGEDCDDSDADVRPGKNSEGETAVKDQNCNGIVGGNETASYEELFCKDSDARGIIMLGDSATAHFHVPPSFMTASALDFSGALPKAMDEFDYPHCSWGTGHAAPEDCPYQHEVPEVDGVFSIYEGMRRRNRCDTNDYQNIGVNGARITASLPLATSLQRDPVADTPALVWLSLMGNDVCSGHQDFDHMTTPETYYEKAMETLQLLDQKLPKGSYVATPGMFDGVLLYDTMHAQQHPLGTTYVALYDYMNCLGESPCWGWLNSDEETRRKTQDHANSLNAVSRALESEVFENLTFVYYEVPWVKMFSDYAAHGLPLTNLIEKVDGFHPSQAGNALFAQNFFAWLEANHPEALGAVNEHNEEIDAMFFSKE
jgi:acyloxyacyl hydrolase